MSEMMHVHKTTSTLRNILVQVMTDPGAPWQVVAAAGDLVALDVRFDDWLLRVAKPGLEGRQIENLLQMSDEVSDLIEQFWLSRSDTGWDALHRMLELAISRLRAAMRP
ncbi:hypothetical protein ACLESD_10100 [Pyxidicoccus sp. 3LFB2]